MGAWRGVLVCGGRGSGEEEGFEDGESWGHGEGFWFVEGEGREKKRDLKMEKVGGMERGSGLRRERVGARRGV